MYGPDGRFSRYLHGACLVSLVLCTLLPCVGVLMAIWVGDWWVDATLSLKARTEKQYVRFGAVTGGLLGSCLGLALWQYLLRVLF
jgi:ABC-type Fe3+ transport system permease subunit